LNLAHDFCSLHGKAEEEEEEEEEEMSLQLTTLD
jgi:hypothetical protein